MSDYTNEYRNVYAIGRNYVLHVRELGNAIPAAPLVFLKPTHAVIPLEGTVELPADAGQIHHEAEIVLHIARPYAPGAAVEELVDRMALGLDLTLRDRQAELKKQGLPWLPAKGFRNSAPLCGWMPFPGTAAAERTEFVLRRNGDAVQRGFARDMLFPFRALIDFVGAHYGLGPGDLLFTGTPEGVGPVADGDIMELYWDGARQGACRIRLT